MFEVNSGWGGGGGSQAIVIHPEENERPAFSNSPGLKSVFEELPSRDKLVWTVCLTVETKWRFQIPPPST